MRSSFVGGFVKWASLALVFGQAIAWPQVERLEMERGLEIEERDSPIVSKLMCSWQRPQAALVRDTIYLYGGYLFYQTVNANGVAGSLLPQNTDLFSLNLTQPFSTTSGNFTKLIVDTPATDQSSPWTTSGHMLANDYEFILYGGQIDPSNATGTSGVLPAADIVPSRELYEHPPVPLPNAPIWEQINTGKVNWHITGGGYANVPSENTAYVFGGSRADSWGEIDANAFTQSVSADNLSDQLIAVDMTTMKGETWTNITAPSSVPARTNGELVWIPAGGKGTLVALGGTAVNQSGIDSLTWTPTDEELAKFLKKGQGFMENVTLYDIEGDKWYTQQTTGVIPNATAEFCAVTATSQDGSSHQIYMYGGAPDINPQTLSAETYSDDVYILSIPSFIWTKAYAGQSNFARKGHRCQKVSDNQFMVVGGIPTISGSCFDGGFVRVFDMNELKFVDNYDPGAAVNYKVPNNITNNIGGTATGGATATPGKWSSDDLSTLLSTKYDGTIKNWWPYRTVNATSTGADSTTSSSAASASASSSSGSSLPSYVPPLLGAILGLLVVIAILCLVLFILRRRRHKMKKLQSDSAASTTAGGARNRRTWSWLVGTNDPEKPPIDSEFDHTPQTDRTEWLESHGTTMVGEFSPKGEKPDPMQEFSNDRIYEMPGTGMSEMPGDAAAQEMHGDIAAQEVQGDAGATELPTHRTTKVNFVEGEKQ